MKTTVLYYSYTGKTDLVARAIAGATGAELRRIEEVRRRKGIFGFIRGGMEALKGKKTEIRPIATDFAGSDLVFIAAPIWAGKIPPALNTFLDQADLAGKKVVGICTFGGSPTEGFARMLSERVQEGKGEWVGFFDIKTGGAKNEEIIRRAEESSGKYLEV